MRPPADKVARCIGAVGNQLAHGPVGDRQFQICQGSPALRLPENTIKLPSK